MAVRKGIAEERGSFLWRPGQQLARVRSPNWSDSRTHRQIQEIPPEEIDLVISKLVAASGGAIGEHLLSDIAKVLGFDRVGPNIRQALLDRIATRRLVEVDDG
jgi:hypothetical protein